MPECEAIAPGSLRSSGSALRTTEAALEGSTSRSVSRLATDVSHQIEIRLSTATSSSPECETCPTGIIHDAGIVLRNAKIAVP